VTHLRHLLDSWTLPANKFTRTGQPHKVMKVQGKDGRRNLPKALHEAISLQYRSEKVEAKWIACYLGGVLPDRNCAQWERFECSHLCIEHDLRGEGLTCIDVACLCWESKATNQSRGNTYCTRLCVHTDCDKTLCACQGVHRPSCK
jgi:hypothetical protein